MAHSIFEWFWGLFWAPFWFDKSKTSIEKRGPVLNCIFCLWRPFGSVWGSILESFLDVFWLPNRAVDRIAKTTKSDDVTALFKVFSGSGGSNIYEKRDRKQLGAPTLLQERLGSLLGPILEPCWEHFGLQNLLKKQAENWSDFWTILVPNIDAWCPKYSPNHWKSSNFDEKSTS